MVSITLLLSSSSFYGDPGGHAAWSIAAAVPVKASPSTVGAPTAASTDTVQLAIHIDQTLGLSTSIEVPSGCTVEAVKNNLAAADGSGDTRARDIILRLPSSIEGGRILEDGEVLARTVRELYFGAPQLASGVSAASASIGSSMLELTIYVDRDLGLSSVVNVPKGCTIRAVKEQIAADDPTGGTRPDEFALRTSDGRACGDGELVSGSIMEFDVCLSDA